MLCCKGQNFFLDCNMLLWRECIPRLTKGGRYGAPAVQTLWKTSTKGVHTLLGCPELTSLDSFILYQQTNISFRHTHAKCDLSMVNGCSDSTIASLHFCSLIYVRLHDQHKIFENLCLQLKTCAMLQTPTLILFRHISITIAARKNPVVHFWKVCGALE